MGCCFSFRRNANEREPAATTLVSLETLEYKDTQKFIPPISQGKVIKVYDGDTFTIGTYLAASTISTVASKPEAYRFSVRMRGIDSPEMKTKNAHEREAAIKAQTALSMKIKNRVVELKNVAYDKYGRILADVYLEEEHINQWMLNNKHAKIYDGGKKEEFEM
jgi:endonuclease YncB( thermonuclease family)